MIGWGGEDVPGHPVPINKEGNACMHMQRDNEGIRLPKLLGLAVAGATLLAGMVVLPATQASADETYGYNAEDDFRPGPLQSTVNPKLTVTKYLSLVQGYSPTGSSKDADVLSSKADLVPAKDVTFNVLDVTSASGNLADIDPMTPTTYSVQKTYAGVTNGQGVITKWYPAGDGGAMPADGTAEATFPAGANHWYILKENREKSWAFNEDNPNKIDSSKYADAAPSFFGLPYAATSLTTDTNTANKVQGYIYNLHLYPKNMNTTQFSKTVQSVKDLQGDPKPQRTAVAGDTVSYKLSQRLYNAGKKTQNDGKLDVSELQGDSKDLMIVDRMSSSLKLVGNFTVKLESDGTTPGPVDLEKDTDYTEARPTENPDSLVTGKKMFTNDVPSKDVSYYQFNFFKALDKVQGFKATSFRLNIYYDAKVTGNGDSTGTDGVANDAASDFRENLDSSGKHQDPIPEHTNVINGVVAFGNVKNQASKFAALPGSEFRLVKSQAESDKYLASDGNFYTTAETLPSGVELYKATANDKGVVAFAALPIFGAATSAPTPKAAGDPGKTVQAGDWWLLETKTPNGWRSPGFPFQKVTFKDAGKTEQDIAQEYGPHATVQPDYSKLSFGKFGKAPTDITAAGGQEIKFNNVPVETYLMHYATTDSDSPLALPLTGGRGILLLLVVGALIMGGALYARNRRNNAARA